MLRGTIAVASGKGGTGKTTVATNMAVAYGQPVMLLDCDVEEPNAHLFLKPKWEESSQVFVLNPAFDDDLCSGCGKCLEHCRFNAIGIFGGKPMLFPELCHSCGACVRTCPDGAIHEAPRAIGVVEWGSSGNVRLVHGRLDVGEAKSPPLINEVRRRGGDGLVIIDAPPGTSCPVIAAVNGADYLVLVTEPTPFGLNDLELAVGMAKVLHLRVGVVVNRADIGDARIRDFCASAGIPILEELAYDAQVARAYSRGEIASLALPDYRRRFAHLLSRIGEEANR